MLNSSIKTRAGVGPIKGDKPAKTMMFGVSAQTERKPDPKAPKLKNMGDDAKKGGKQSNKTMLGMPALGAEGTAKPAVTPKANVISPKPKATAKPTAKPSKAKPAGPGSAGPAKTMLGMAPVLPNKDGAGAPPASQTTATPRTSNAPMAQVVSSGESIAQKAQKASGKQTSSKKGGEKKAALEKKTVLGMPGINPDEILAEAKKKKEMPSKQPTQLGMPISDAPASPVEAPEAEYRAELPAEEPSLDLPARTEPFPVQDDEPPFRDMESRDDISGPVREDLSGSVREDPSGPMMNFNDTIDRDDDEDDTVSSGRNQGLLIALVAAGAVAIIAAGLVIYLLMFGKAPVLNPQVFPSPDGKSVTVVLGFADAPPGTTIQLAGQTTQVNQGSARVSIPMSQLKLGTNEVVVAYIEPGEAPAQMTFPIVLRHSISDEFKGLDTEKPFVNVLFQVAEGVGLAVEGKPVQVTNGTYVHKVDLNTLAGKGTVENDYLMHKVTFQLTGQSGVAEQGEHMVAVPFTRLQIDRPADKVVVASDMITCSGSTESGAQIQVNGNAIGVTAVGFNTSVPLPTIGEHTITVSARAPGKAPRTSTVTVTRLESLDNAIKEWSADLDTKLDYPTLGRDPNALSGKKMKLNGRVVNISTEKGVTAFILYVGQGCPAQAQCGVYVVYRGETDAGLQSWVDVYGTVRGNRAVDLQDGRKMDMPAIDAQFVIKSEAPKQGKGKRKKR